MATSNANKVTRKYNDSDSTMLTACSVIMTHAMSAENKPFLQSKRSNWTDVFFTDLAARVKKAFGDVLGVDNLGDQTKASNALYKAMGEVEPKLSSFKRQVEVDFEDDNREKQILDSLGFKLLKKVQNGDQEALVELLESFNKNMTDDLEKEIVDAGTDKSYITDIKGFAAVIRDGNIAQEAKKGAKKTISAEGVNTLNGIYKDVMKVAKIANGFYTEVKDAENAEKFSYNKVVKTLNNQGGPKKDEA